MPLCRVINTPPITTELPRNQLHPEGGATIDFPPGSGTPSKNALDQLLVTVSDHMSRNLSQVVENTTAPYGSMSWANDTDLAVVDGEHTGLLSEIQLIKAVVLMVVVSLLLLSTCTVVFRTFSLFSGKKDDGNL